MFTLALQLPLQLENCFLDMETVQPSKYDQEILGNRCVNNAAGEHFKYLPLSHRHKLKFFNYTGELL